MTPEAGALAAAIVTAWLLRRLWRNLFPPPKHTCCPGCLHDKRRKER